MDVQGIQNYAKEMCANKGVISVTVISVIDGNVLAYKSINEDVDNRLAASFQIEVLRQISRGMNYVDNLEDKEIQDVTVSLKDQLHFISSSSSREFVTHIISDSDQINEGMLKMLNRKLIKQIS